MTARGEHHRVAVVGGGLAGLVCADELPRGDVVVLEAADRPGGRIETATRGEQWVNLGAHVLNGDTAAIPRRCRELGVETFAVDRRDVLVSLGGRLTRLSHMAAAPLRLPLAAQARRQLVAVGAQALLAGGTRTMADLVRGRHADVVALADAMCQRLGAELREVRADSFAHMLRYGMERPVGVVGGTARLVEALARRLGSAVRTGAVVERVDATRRPVRLTLRHGGRRVQISADTCVVTVPAPSAARLIHPLAPDLQAALEQRAYGRYLVVGLFLDQRRAMPWDATYTTVACGRRLAYAFNPSVGLPARGARGAVATYCGGQAASRLWDAPDGAVVDAFVDDLSAIFDTPVRPLLADAVVRRHRYGAPLPGARLPLDGLPPGVLLAGDHVGGVGLEPTLAAATATAEAIP